VVPAAPADPAEALQSLLELCNSQGASDLHLTSGYVPALRVDGDVVSVEGWGEPSAERLEKILWTVDAEDQPGTVARNQGPRISRTRPRKRDSG